MLDPRDIPTCKRITLDVDARLLPVDTIFNFQLKDAATSSLLVSEASSELQKDEAKWAYWTKQIEGWRASGLSRNAYCQREGLKPTTFDYWRPLIAANHAEVKPAKQAARANDITLVPAALAPGHPLIVDPPRTDASSATIKLTSPSGWEMHLPTSIEANWLIAVLCQFP